MYFVTFRIYSSSCSGSVLDSVGLVYLLRGISTMFHYMLTNCIGLQNRIRFGGVSGDWVLLCYYVHVF